MATEGCPGAEDDGDIADGSRSAAGSGCSGAQTRPRGGLREAGPLWNPAPSGLILSSRAQCWRASFPPGMVLASRDHARNGGPADTRQALGRIPECPPRSVADAAAHRALRAQGIGRRRCTEIADGCGSARTNRRSRFGRGHLYLRDRPSYRGERSWGGSLDSIRLEPGVAPLTTGYYTLRFESGPDMLTVRLDRHRMTGAGRLLGSRRECGRQPGPAGPRGARGRLEHL